MADRLKNTEVIQVYVRVRPPLPDEIDSSVAIHVLGNSVKVQSEKHEISCSYDKVFDEVADQQSIFDEIKPLLNNLLSGYNACIFAYGQTSAGKSYTMLGPDGGNNIFQIRENWGIIPRSAQFLFGELISRAAEGSLTYLAKASFLQIYNENIYDLLSDAVPIHTKHPSSSDSADADRERDKDAYLKIREVPGTGNRENGCQEVYVSGLSEFRVQTVDDVLRIIALGSKNRTTRATEFNMSSSRSHAILQISFEIESEESGATILNRAKLSLVDLAGSEKMHTNLDGDEGSRQTHLRELTAINKSLSSLGNVIAALTTPNRTHIPYRDSKLTRLLQDSLGGNTRTILVACVTPLTEHAGESVSTLQFADRARRVMIKAKANSVVDDKALLSRAQAEISRLKLLLKHALARAGMGEGDALMEDGETADEMQRLLKENEMLRTQVASLRQQLASGDGRGRRSKQSNGHLPHPLHRPKFRSGPDESSLQGNSSHSDPNRNGADDTSVSGTGRGGLVGRLLAKVRDPRGPRELEGDDGEEDPEEDGSLDDTGSISNRKTRRKRLSEVVVSKRSSHSSPGRLFRSDDESRGKKPPWNDRFNSQGDDSSIASDRHGGRRDHHQQLDPQNSSIASKKGDRRQSRGVSKPDQTRNRKGRRRSSDADGTGRYPRPPLPQQRKGHSHGYGGGGDDHDEGSLDDVAGVDFNSLDEGSAVSVEEEQGGPADGHYDDVLEEREEDYDVDDMEYSHNFEEDAEDLDLGKLRERVDRSHDSKQMQALEDTLMRASEATYRDLKQQEAALLKKQAEREELEQQLRDLMRAQNHPDAEPESCDVGGRGRTPLTEDGDRLDGRTSPPANKDTALSIASLGVVSSSSSSQAVQVGARPTSTAGLTYSMEDIDKTIQIFSFRFNSWDTIKLVDYEGSRGMHRCLYANGTSQWLNLKKKPIRSYVDS